ncbi:ARM repeat-containing protein [Cylindrobasidium torrendii FP15055 ss-10]|uniref:ARM repeat-containing protein n=1 Tax=Cylindrobasidium torrendii FP15055 ss-10 TaxID=1314674 RepID=A0A0D7B787_9AGAR|nr:ARM repeat-containing protein [Cylindrobasidium torrendii FP15055 ss-10]
MLASQSDRDAQKLVTAGIVPTLIFLLKIRAAECTGLELVLATLGLLAHDPLSANTMFRTNTTHTLLELFKASISEEVSVLALWCLNRMCRTAEVANGLIKQGLSRVLLEQGFSPALSTPPIWRMAAYTLGVLIFNDGIAEMVAEQGAVVEIVDLLQRSSDRGGDPQDVCAALYAAARMSRSIKLAKLLAKAGLVPLLAASLATSTDPSVLLWSARAAGCLMRPNSGEMAKTLLDAGVAHGLARLPSVLSVSEVEPLGSFAFAIQRFSCAEWGSGTRKALVEAGVVDALLAGLRTVADEPYPAIHVEMALAVSFLGDVGGGAIRKEIISAGGITILKRVAAVASADVAKVCLMAVTSITGNIWTRNAASAKTAMSHNWNGGCPDWHAPCPVKLTVLRDGFDSVSTI